LFRSCLAVPFSWQTLVLFELKNSRERELFFVPTGKLFLLEKFVFARFRKFGSTKKELIFIAFFGQITGPFNEGLKNQQHPWDCSRKCCGYLAPFNHANIGDISIHIVSTTIITQPIRLCLASRSIEHVLLATVPTYHTHTHTITRFSLLVSHLPIEHYKR
jgi:hypothetical protein